jgi:hypothetical protein
MGDIDTASFRSGSDGGTLQARHARPPASMAHHDHRIEGVAYLNQAEPRARACARGTK